MSENKIPTTVTLRPDQKDYMNKTDKNVSSLVREVIDEQMKEDGYKVKDK